MAETMKDGAGQVRVMSADNNIYTFTCLFMHFVSYLIYLTDTSLTQKFLVLSNMQGILVIQTSPDPR